ncbi:MAG: hypothetical protein FWD27_02760 [Coriobacteriia bacterium]|nr:hypothetical protein [Coriobacteriia bacterium]
MRNDLRLNSLREQLHLNPEKLLDLEKKLKEFSCTRDNDIERFIQSNAIAFERSGLARTYFYTLLDKTSGKERTGIAAYFSVAITAADFSGVGRSKREKILGRTPARERQDYFGGLLIAQLARNDCYDGSVITGAELMSDCLEVIEQGRDFVGGRALYLDCKKALVPYYEKFGFKELRLSEDDSGLSTLFMGLPRIHPPLSS